MMKSLIIIAITLFVAVLPVFAQEVSEKSKEIPVPEISYSQKVEIVVPIQKNPNVLSATINQDGKDVILSMMISSSVKLELAKELGEDFVVKTKTVTLDDPAGKKKPGKGLYNYEIYITRATGKTVIEGIKEAEKKEIEWF